MYFLYIYILHLNAYENLKLAFDLIATTTQTNAYNFEMKQILDFLDLMGIPKDTLNTYTYKPTMSVCVCVSEWEGGRELLLLPFCFCIQTTK